MSKNSDKDFAYYVAYVFFIPFHIVESIVERFIGRYTDKLFENLVYRNIKNQWLIKLLNILSKIVGWFFFTISFIFSFFIGVTLLMFIFQIADYKKYITNESLSVYVFLGLPSFIIATIRYKISQVIDSSEYQQLLSGIRAENTVKKFIEAIAPTKNGWSTFHNILLVFNKGLPTEWSREIDHLMIRNNSVYIIETKYKSGTIYANIDYDTWRVENNGQESKMRNALKQVIKACEIFDREFNLPNFTAIPIVAIVGNDVKIVNAPTNVVSYLDLGTVISAFELNHNNNKISTSELINSLNKSIATDKQSFERHIKRAEEVKRKDGYNKIVAGAHRNY
jgi:hypothetical protein